MTPQDIKIKMTSSSSSSSSMYNHTAFSESGFLDSEPLHLSGNSAGFDGFDFDLDDDEVDDGERLFADSKGSADLAVLLDDSQGSAAMDFQFETLESSLNDMRFSAIQENGPGERPARRRNQRRRDGSPSPLSRSCGRIQLNAIDFDPPAAQRGSFVSAAQSASGCFGGPRRQASEGDLSMLSYATAQSSPQPNPAQLAFRSVPEGGHVTEDSYNEALQSLARSMKRTEETRRHVMMQRNMLTPAQQAALSSAKEQLQAQNHQVQQQATHAAPVPALPAQEVHESSQRSSIVAAFLSGSRGTLTNGLEQSRKQLSMYMGQMNNQTF